MNSQLYQTLGAAGDVISLADMKQHLRVEQEDTEEDGLIEAIRDAAVQFVEKEARRAFHDQEWELRVSCFEDEIELPMAPLLEVVSVKYVDEDGNTQTVSPSLYHVIGVGSTSPGKISLRSGEDWPDDLDDREEVVLVRFRAGYVDMSVSPPSGSVPKPLIHAAKLVAGTLFENRETHVTGTIVSEIPALELLLKNYKTYL